MWENAEKMRTRITPNTDTFYVVIVSFFPFRFLFLRDLSSLKENTFFKVSKVSILIVITIW